MRRAGLASRDSETESPSSRHLPALDGLRGIAILLVIAYHTFTQAPQSATFDKLFLHVMSVGWAGVDLFFVLSGFLITGILLDAKHRARFMRTFYARRILRIVPAYVVFVLFCIWLAAPVGVATPEAAQQMRSTQWWYWGYAMNVLIASRGWSAVSLGSHLWSLSVEEQFYLLWPAVVLLMSMRSLQRVTIACFVSAELVRAALILMKLHPEANYVLLPSRMDTLATGAFLACAFRTPELWERTLKRRRETGAIALAALLAVIAMHRSLDFHKPLVQLIAFPALATLSGSAVVSATREPRWLVNPILRFLGKYSYAMYLWHGIVILCLLPLLGSLHLPTLAGTNLPYFALMLSSVLIATSAVALVSWTVIERPFLGLKRFVSYSSETA